MTTVEDLYLGVIRDSITRHPRSLQKRIGPSEIGKPCDRWILHKLHGDGEPDRGPAWKPAIGTAVHDQLERWFDAANVPNETGDVTNWEWVTEQQVVVGTIGGQDIPGHSDLFHVPTGTVIDHKIVGPKQLTKYRIHGPSQQYRVQAHLYGKGFTDDGGWGPCRTVAIAFLPRDGELQNAVFWSEPYNPHLAGEAMLRANRLNLLLQVAGLEGALAASPLCDDEWCTWCRTEKRAQHRAAGGSLFDVPPAEPTPAAAGNAIPPLAELIPERTCEHCGWQNHEKRENAAEWERSWQVHEQLLCPARAAAPVTPIRPAAPPVAIAQLCDDFGLPLHPEAAADGSTVHPTCITPFPPAPRPIPSTPQPAAAAPAPIRNLFDR
ncbi:hypothetical protein [Microbacterium sp. NPDC089188]|uniref:hypothetical protein n=1 Tax=Microbacterium sp. NPDC089188 TaxID=3154971 RepID=UPI00341693D9